MAEVFGRTMRLVRDVEISLHHPTARGRAFDDLARCKGKFVVNTGEIRQLQTSIRWYVFE